MIPQISYLTKQGLGMLCAGDQFGSLTLSGNVGLIACEHIPIPLAAAHQEGLLSTMLDRLLYRYNI